MNETKQGTDYGKDVMGKPYVLTPDSVFHKEPMQTQHNNFKLCVEVGRLLDFTKAVKELCYEAKLKINIDGLEVAALDPANVCMINVHLKNTGFIEYTIKENITIGINFETFYTILKDNKKEMVKLTLSKDNLKLLLNFRNGINSEIGLVDLGEKEHKIPLLNYKVGIKVLTKEFKQFIRNISNVSDSVIFDFNNDLFTLKSDSKINNINVLVANKQVLENRENKITSKYSIEYVKHILNSVNSDELTLKFDSDYPLSVVTKNNGVEALYILAPRVEEN